MRVLFYQPQSPSGRATERVMIDGGARAWSREDIRSSSRAARARRSRRRRRPKGVETVAVDAEVDRPPAARGICAKCSRKTSSRSPIVTTERDHLIAASAMRFAERGGVLRRIPSFDKLEMSATVGKLALKMATAGAHRLDGARAQEADSRLVDPDDRCAARRRCSGVRRRASRRAQARPFERRSADCSSCVISIQRRAPRSASCSARSRCSRSDIRTCTWRSSAPGSQDDELRMHACRARRQAARALPRGRATMSSA